MPIALRTTVDTTLPAGEALEGLLRPGQVPGRTILRHDPSEVLYQEGDEVTTHLVLLQAKALRAAREAWRKDIASLERGEDEEEDAGRVNGHVQGPFGEVWFTLRAFDAGERTRIELEGTYEPKGFLLRMAPKRSAKALAEEFEEGLRVALARQEGRVEGIVEATTERPPEAGRESQPAS